MASESIQEGVLGDKSEIPGMILINVGTPFISNLSSLEEKYAFRSLQSPFLYSPVICRVVSTESYILEVEEIILFLIGNGIVPELSSR